MKEENKHTWEQLEAQWRAQLNESEEPAPGFNWELLDAANSRPVIPMWRKIAQSPWAWAAVLGVAIGINWQDVETEQTHLPVFAQVETKIQASDPLVTIQLEKRESIRQCDEVKQPIVIPQNASEEVEVVNLAVMPKVVEKVDDEVILVRIDIDPIEEINAQPVVEMPEKPIKRKRNLLGQIIRQVIARDSDGWREIANSNEKLAEGIHQVANTVLRTEQSVKQTLQLQ